MDGHWANEEEFSEYHEIQSFEGWIDDPLGTKIMLGANNLMFVPTIKDAEPEAGAARVGSLAASLLENASCASVSDKISQLLIDRVALTADSGLRFYEAMIENSRAAINNI